MKILLLPGLLSLLNVALVAGMLVVGPQIPTHQLIYDTQVDGYLDIFLLDVNRQLAHNLTDNRGDDRHPEWSPDGSQIVFESWRLGIRAVYMMDVYKGVVKRLSADAGASEYDPRWTADGDAVVFRSFRRSPGGETTVTIYQVEPDGSNLQRLDALPAIFQQVPDRLISQRFVDGKWGVFVTEGEETRRLVSHNILYRETPQWSPDNELIAFLLQDEVRDPEIYVMAADGSDIRQITADGARKSNLHWRPS
ncbi:MAG: hypothetical protein CL610_18480 [Anaerolineaceae bacterium]|nr:hypothetical protein [Anaerolineaceae bacterium]